MKSNKYVILLIVFVLFLTGSNYHVINASDGKKNNHTITSPYQYPVHVGSEEWNTLDLCEKREACRIPSELIEKLTTKALLLSILDYPFICDIELYSSIEEGIAVLQESFPPLNELLTRADAIDTLEEYITAFQQEETSDNDVISIKYWIAEDLYNYLIRQQNSDAWTDPNNGFLVTRVYTPRHSPVNVYIDLSYEDHGTTQTKVQAYNSQQVLIYGVNLLSHGSSSYNCHSYAWYSTSLQNPYWMDNPGKYMTDGSYSPHNTPQVGDIVTYKYGNTLVHSGIVYSISPTIMVKSKWGCSGLFIHALGNCPYWNNGAQNCQFWRAN